MEDERFSSSKENPRGASESRSAPPILERFRVAMKEREEELRAAGHEDPLPPPPPGEVVRLYEDLLAELSFNSKPIITELTIIAGEHRNCAQGIANAICARILEAPADQKLPSLYLLDSIVKNIGREYVRHFAARLPEVFCEAYNQVHSSLYSSMRHLFGTWGQVFSPYVLRQIQDELQLPTPDNKQSSGFVNMRESSSPRPLHGIHVNPKYLEARCNFDDSAVDQHARGVSSSLQVYGQKSSRSLSELDFDHPDVLPSRVGMTRRGSPLTAAKRPPSIFKAEERLPYAKSKVSQPLSPPRIRRRMSESPRGDRFEKDISPSRTMERASPSHSAQWAGPGNLRDKNGRLEKNLPVGDGYQQPEPSSTYGYDEQRTRELIDTYGNCRGKDTYHKMLPNMQQLDSNGTNSGKATRKWQSFEEEEYVWENMSPTLADRSRGNSLPTFGPCTSSLATEGAIGRPRDTFLESDFRDSWHGHVHLPSVDDRASRFEDRIPSGGSGQRFLNQRYLDDIGSKKELQHQISSHHAQEPWKSSYFIPKSSGQSLSPKSRGRVLPMPLSSSGMTVSIVHKMPVSYDDPADAEVRLRRSSGAHSDSSYLQASIIENHPELRPHSPHTSPMMWPSVHRSQPLPLQPVPPHQKQFQSSLDLVEASKKLVYEGSHRSSFLPHQQYVPDRKGLNLDKLIEFPNRQPFAMQYQQSQEQGMRIPAEEFHGSLLPAPGQMAAQHLNHVQSRGPGVIMGSVLPNAFHGMPSSQAMFKMNDPSAQLHGAALPPLPPGPPPTSSQMGPASAAPTSAFSGLFNSLMEKGLITLGPQGPSQESVSSQDNLGVEFNVELLKVRHESAISALYGALPRQCTTCGQRFKSQEEHSSHMDWHVTKNRMAKNRKQKPSRKWFVNAKEWLSGAETLGNDILPGFLPTEAVTEQTEEKEMAVPADENQNLCALCGEPFDDFYSDEAEEWMYKGAVYLNVPDGNILGLDKSQLGPIVHVKCRSESSKGF